jgi:cytochrome c oxidase subunit 2
MAIAIVLILLVVVSILFHFLSPWWFTPIASNWGMIDDTVNLTFWVTGFVFVAVNLFMAWAIVKYRHKEGALAHYEPENKKLESWLVGITAVGVVAMLAPGLFVWGQFVTVPDDAKEFEAVGQQWQWSFRFPGEDGVFGAVDTRHITVQNQLGVSPDDPNGQDDVIVLSKEVHLPIDQPMKALLRGKDVLHNFAVPQFRVKMDLVPGMVTFQWFTPIRLGTYEILCEELCGLGHFAMRGLVTVDTQEDFDVWLDAQPTFAEMQAKPVGNATAGQANFAVCAACHGAQGEGNPLLNAPKTAGQSAWYLERQLNYFKQGVRGSHDDDLYGKQMAPMAATLVDDAAMQNVIAYIQTLPDTNAAQTITGDAANGRRLYISCAACHGADGQGVWSTSGPRLAGMSDWYLVRALQNYKDGIRGTHQGDNNGHQMTMMAGSLVTDENINDVVAYINTL